MLEWEEIKQNNAGYLSRAKVIGGWLVKYTDNVLKDLNSECTMQDGYEWRSSITFVPDVNYEWSVY